MKNERNVRRGSAAASSASPQHGRTQVSNRGGVTGKAGIAASLPVVERAAEVTDEELTSRRSTVDQTDALDQTTNQVDSSEADDADVLLEDDRSPLSVETRQSRRFRWPGHDQLLAWAPFWGIILLAAILRFWGLGDRPLHHDESLHAYFSLQLMHNLEHWSDCFNPAAGCYRYNPVLHGPFQFHIIALTYKISQLLGVYPNGVNTTTVRIPAALLGTVIVGLPFFLRDYLGRRGALLACFLLAVSPSMVYFSRFAREDIYMACFTLLLVVSLARYVRDRKIRWLILAAVALMLSYATKEATFLTIAIFGSFTVMLLVWELGARWTVREHIPPQSFLARVAPKNASPLLLVLLVILLAPLAKWFFGWMKDLSDYVNNPANTTASDAFVQKLKDNTVAALPWFCLILACFALFMLLVDARFIRISSKKARSSEPDPVLKQPLLSTIVGMPWFHWFAAIFCGGFVFVFLFSVVFTNINGGIGDGIWQGLYYWIQQQQVARGSQPWYYYLLLIPLYEQVGLVFGLIGIVRCVIFPSRFRLFLVYWFIGSVFIYSWAGEKMPWLVIHMTMPMMLLAALGLDPLVLRAFQLVRDWHLPAIPDKSVLAVSSFARLRKHPSVKLTSAALGTLLALFLLVLTLQNMVQVNYVHAADGPHEMMIYVQTTPDVTLVMSKIDALDQKLYHGTHQLTIGVTTDADWPFYWYLRDYTNVCYTFPTSCSVANPDVIISSGDAMITTQTQYALPSANGAQPAYLYHQYHLRSWWDEGYKPPVCQPSATNSCAGQPTWGGVGPFLWLSYGDSPPAGASFNLGLAVQHIWQWWWQRIPFGSTIGSTDMGFLVRRDLGIMP